MATKNRGKKERKTEEKMERRDITTYIGTTLASATGFIELQPRRPNSL